MVRIAPRELLTNDPEIWRTMLNVRSPYTRSDWYSAIKIDPDHDNVLSERDDERHNMLRSKMAAGVSQDRLSFNVLMLMLSFSTPEKTTQHWNNR